VSRTIERFFRAKRAAKIPRSSISKTKTLEFSDQAVWKTIQVSAKVRRGVTKVKHDFQTVEGANGMSWQQASVLRQGASRPYPMRMCGMEHPSTRPDARLVIAAIAKADILKFGGLQHAWCKQISGFAISGRRARSASNHSGRPRDSRGP
jgi:hypothetical protein